MQVVKDNIAPTLIILLAGLLISFAAVPLANTDFAEGFRSGSTAEIAEAEPVGEEEVALSGALLLLPLVKVAVIMGIGAGLTTLVTRGVRRISGATSR